MFCPDSGEAYIFSQGIQETLAACDSGRGLEDHERTPENQEFFRVRIRHELDEGPESLQVPYRSCKNTPASS